MPDHITRYFHKMFNRWCVHEMHPWSVAALAAAHYRALRRSGAFSPKRAHWEAWSYAALRSVDPKRPSLR